MTARSISLPPVGLSSPFLKATQRAVSAPAVTLSPPSDPSDLQNFSFTSQQLLNRTQFHLFKKKLEKEYNPEVVELLFYKLNKLNKTSLSADDCKRFKVWCHYLDVEQRFLKNIYHKHAPSHRLLKHLLRYTQGEVYHRMRHTFEGNPLTHRDIEQCEKNLFTFLEMQISLVETFGEELCHRALTKIDLYPSELLIGLMAYPSFDEFAQKIEAYFKEEIALTKLIEESSYEELNQRAEEIKNRLHHLPNYRVAKALFIELALKAGRTKWLKATLPKSLIQQQAELFEASRLSHHWASTQKELIPLHESGGIQTQNTVYFLKGASSEAVRNKPIAVFKEASRAAAKEVLMYDISVIFGLQNAYAPTKLTQVQDKFGSLQTFQNGISWNQFYDLYLPPEEFKEIPPQPHPTPYPPLKTVKPWQIGHKAHVVAAFFNRNYALDRQNTLDIPVSPLELLDAYTCAPLRKMPPLQLQPWQLGKAQKIQEVVLTRLYTIYSGDQKAFKKHDPYSFFVPYLKPKAQKVPLRTFNERFRDFEDALFDRVSMEDFLKAGLGTLLLGNRDLHTGNFFFVPKDDGQYSIVMFDNEESLYPSNYVICDDQGYGHLPARNALLIFPQADIIIAGEMKKTLQEYVNSFESRFNQFLDYLHSSKGQTLLQHLPHRKISHSSLKAFKQRIEKLIDFINSREDCTYREIYYHVFPLYETYLKLVQFIEPFYPEMLVGYHPIEELCDLALEGGHMTEEQKEQVQNYIHSFDRA